jgi:hypothetical protein
VSGAGAGLVAWTVTAAVKLVLPWDPGGFEVVFMALFGLLAGIAASLALGYTEERRLSAGAFLARAGLGCLAGVLAGLAAYPMRDGLNGVSPALARILEWMLLASLTALLISLPGWLRCADRAPIPFAWGLAGGLIGGGLMDLAGFVPDVLAAVAFMVAGAGATAAASIRPNLRGTGLLRFVSSTDTKTHQKFNDKRATWKLEDGQAIVIGRDDNPVEPGSPDIPLHMPDPEIAPRHARIHAKDGAFILSRHKDIRNPAGLARWVLKVGADTVADNRRLQHGELVSIGSTTLAFDILPEED